ncbi:MAG: serine hydrolase, partial [Pseudomonadota bacterium]|nr:serine hydrolase [Pseudomonadota bacterium]
MNKMRIVMPAIVLFFSAQILADVEQARLDAVAADLQARIDEGKLSGAVVMVAQDGEVLMHEAMGYQNVEDKVPMSTNTI